MKQHLRVVFEVAVLATVVDSVPIPLMLVSIPIFNFFGSFGINLSSVDSPAMLIGIVFPYVAAFYYGYRRKLQSSRRRCCGW